MVHVLRQEKYDLRSACSMFFQHFYVSRLVSLYLVYYIQETVQPFPQQTMVYFIQ